MYNKSQRNAIITYVVVFTPSLPFEFAKASLLLVPKSFSLSLAIVSTVIFVIPVTHKYKVNLEHFNKSLRC